MACTYTGSIEGDRALAASEHLTKVTDMLCRTLTLVDMYECFVEEMGAHSSELVLPQDIQKFWKAHKKLDAQRQKDEIKEAEKARKKALAKLTADDIKLLGIKI